MGVKAILVLLVLVFMLVALVRDRMRPGMILLSGAVALLCTGILTPKEMLEGFSNKGMITVAMLFLVSEGVRRSGLLEKLIRKILPSEHATVRQVMLRMLAPISCISAFLNNTPVVVIFAPMVKRWAERMNISPTKLLIPLSYATILGGTLTLIGSSTNLVLYGMAVDAGLPSFGMFEIGKLGLPLVFVGLIYIIFASGRMLPSRRTSDIEDLETEAKLMHRIEVVLGPRFPAINRKMFDFDFKQKYGAIILEVHRGGTTMLMKDMRKERFRDGDTLVLLADDSFMKNWGDSSFFLVVANGHDPEPTMPVWKRQVALLLMVFMIGGAFVFGLPGMPNAIHGVKLDMFFFVCLTTIIMAWLKIFPARKYTKYISWDILVTIACAFAISKAMLNSGLAEAIASFAVSVCDAQNPYVLLAATFVVTNIFTEIVTNNAAVALGFPISLSLAGQLGADPMPFVFTTLMAANSSFATPIGYQTNMIVQGFGNYKFTDFTRFGLPLNIISLIITVTLAPLIWPL